LGDALLISKPRALVFVVVSYLLALIVDVVFYSRGFSLASTQATASVFAVWGFARMWSVALAVVLCLRLQKERVKDWLRGLFRFNKKTVALYLLSPLLVYLALGIYVLMALPLGYFDFNAYVNIVADIIKSSHAGVTSQDAEKLARLYAFAQIPQAYLFAITINALFALGEEIGWRAYLYKMLGSRPSFRNVALIGASWGLWHASAIVLLGFNYTYNRALGALLFMLLCIAFTYPHLIVVSLSNSVLPAASLHGAINALWGLTLYASSIPRERGEIVLGLGFLGTATWSVLSLLTALVTKSMGKVK